MRSHFVSLRLAVPIAVLLSSAPAFAQHGKADAYEYRFDDDLMQGGVLDGDTPMITVRRGAARVRLLRPRVSFVTEMFKSVEHL